MSDHAQAVVFMPRNRLSKILSATDAKAFTEHVASAEREVHHVIPLVGESITDDVQALIGLCRLDEGEIFGRCREVGWLALRIVESARLADRPELADAAEGVWEMIAALSARGVWHTDALKLHVETLQALTAAEGVDIERRAMMTAALCAMRQTIGAREDG